MKQSGVYKRKQQLPVPGRFAALSCEAVRSVAMTSGSRRKVFLALEQATGWLFSLGRDPCNLSPSPGANNILGDHGSSQGDRSISENLNVLLAALRCIIKKFNPPRKYGFECLPVKQPVQIEMNAVFEGKQSSFIHNNQNTTITCYPIQRWQKCLCVYFLSSSWILVENKRFWSSWEEKYTIYQKRKISWNIWINSYVFWMVGPRHISESSSESL